MCWIFFRPPSLSSPYKNISTSEDWNAGCPMILGSSRSEYWSSGFSNKQAKTDPPATNKLDQSTPFKGPAIVSNYWNYSYLKVSKFEQWNSFRRRSLYCDPAWEAVEVVVLVAVWRCLCFGIHSINDSRDFGQLDNLELRRTVDESGLLVSSLLDSLDPVAYHEQQSLAKDFRLERNWVSKFHTGMPDKQGV